MSKFEEPWDQKKNEYLKEIVTMIGTGASYATVQKYAVQTGCFKYIIERLAWLGIVYPDGMEFSDSSRDYALRASMKRYVDKGMSVKALDVEKEMLMKPTKLIMGHESRYVFEPTVWLCDTGFEEELTEPDFIAIDDFAYSVKDSEGKFAVMLPENKELIN